MLRARLRVAEVIASATQARPLAPVAGGFVLGIAAGRGLDLSLALPLAGLAFLSAALIILVGAYKRVHRGTKPRFLHGIGVFSYAQG